MGSLAQDSENHIHRVTPHEILSGKTYSKDMNEKEIKVTLKNTCLT